MVELLLVQATRGRTSPSNKFKFNKPVADYDQFYWLGWILKVGILVYVHRESSDPSGVPETKINPILQVVDQREFWIIIN